MMRHAFSAFRWVFVSVVNGEFKLAYPRNGEIVRLSRLRQNTS